MKVIKYIIVFLVTFVVSFGFFVAVLSYGNASGLGSAYPGPDCSGYPAGYDCQLFPVVVGDWNSSLPTITPLPTSTPSRPPTQTPCEIMCGSCSTAECYQYCLDNCGCEFGPNNEWICPMGEEECEEK